MLDQAVGAASDGAALAVACHLALCSPCRALSADLDTIGASLISAAVPETAAGAGMPRQEVRARILADISSRPGAARVAAAVPTELPAAVLEDLPPLPPVLLRAIAAQAKVAWRWMIPGIRGITLAKKGPYTARLLRLRPGVVIPRHDHGGAEYTVVFAGGLDDEGGHLGAGDALTMLPGDRHRQQASPGPDCIALVVNEAPPRPVNLLGRILKRIAGI